MRSTLPLRAGVLAGALSMTLTTVGPDPAEAQTGAAPVSAEVKDPRLTFGERLGVSGVAPASTAGQRAVLEFRADAEPKSTWRQLGSRVVRSGGRYAVRAPVPRTGLIRVRIFAQDGAAGFASRHRRVRVRAAVIVRARRLQVTAGKRISTTGSVRPGASGLPVALQVHRGGGWATLDSARTGRDGSYTLSSRRRATMSARARVRVSGRAAGVGTTTRGLGRLNVYRLAHASWYGPGLYGNRLGCGGRLSAGRLGVAHKQLPCGTLVTLRRNGRSVRVPVIDRGPYVGGREYDLTEATAQRLGFRGHGPILVTR